MNNGIEGYVYERIRPDDTTTDTQDISGVAGQYVLKATDANSCETFKFFNIGQSEFIANPEITASVSSFSCQNQTITLSAGNA